MTMQLEDYFDFLAPNDIRIKGHRIGIETVLYEYIFRSRKPEQIVRTYPTLTLEEVYATITCYYHNQEAVDRYLADWIEHGDRMRAQQAQNRNSPYERLLRLDADKILAEAKAEYDAP
jgi:uncharacterized protein (DUF433 family)